MNIYKQLFPKYKNMALTIVFSLFWALGLIFGYILASESSVYTLKHTFSFERVSFVGLTLSVFVPLVISAAAVCLSSSYILLPIAFFKALLFSYCNCAISIAYGNAAWLARWFYTFSDTLMLICLLWFCLKNLAGKSAHLKKEFVFCLLSGILLVGLDYFIVSPFSVMLFNH